MATALIKPFCLHIPPLLGESKVTMSWEQVDGAAGYELDCLYDETFDSASRGKSWEDLDDQDKIWPESNENLTWNDFENLDAQGWSWRNIEFEGPLWNEIELRDLSWRAFSGLPPKFTIFRGSGFNTTVPDQGLSFADIDAKDSKWHEIESNSMSWSESEYSASQGLTWNSLDARFLSWIEVSDTFTWDELEQCLPDNKMHKGCEVEVAPNKRYAMFRVRAYDDFGEYSEYLTTDKLFITSMDVVNLTKKANESFCMQIDVRNVLSFEGEEFTLIYDPNHLRLDEVSPPSDHPNYISTATLDIVSNVKGTIKFKCKREIGSDSSWSGLVFRMEFTSLKQGNTQIKLERINYSESTPVMGY